MTLNPHAPIFMPKDHTVLFSIYRTELLTEMDASATQDLTDLNVPAKCSKTSPNPKVLTNSEQLHLLTAPVDQLRIISEQALEQTKSLIRTFPLANIKKFQYLPAVQQQAAQFFVDFNIEKHERLNYTQLFNSLKMSEPNCVDRSMSPSLLPFLFLLQSIHRVQLFSKTNVPSTMPKNRSLCLRLL